MNCTLAEVTGGAVTDPTIWRVKPRREHEPGRLVVSGNMVLRESRPMPKKRADSFRAMYDARTDIAQATLHKAKGGWVVRWGYTDPARQDRLFRRYQGDQEERARTEMGDWAWEPHDGASWAYVTTTERDPDTQQMVLDKDGFPLTNTYRVDEGTCTCPHFRTRCSAAGVNCKHICGWRGVRAEFGWRDSSAPAPVRSRPTRIAQARQTREQPGGIAQRCRLDGALRESSLRARDLSDDAIRQAAAAMEAEFGSYSHQQSPQAAPK